MVINSVGDEIVANALARFALRIIQFDPAMYRKAFHFVYPSFKVGRGTYGYPEVREWGEGANLTIGSFCSIADHVTIFLGGEHRTQWVSTYPFPEMWRCAKGMSGHVVAKGDVTIGSDVWIASGATILSGVSIGHGAVIGCRAVVSKNVEPYAVVGSNPARLLKKRFSEEVIQRLCEIAWWTWPDDEIARAVPLLLSSNVDEFIRHALARKQAER